MPPGRPIALRSPSPFESDGCDRGSEDFPAAPTDGTLSCFRRDAWEPVIGLVPSRGSGSSLVGGLPGVRTASAQDYFKRRARKRHASRFRVNAMASRPQTQTTRSQIVSPRIETHRGPSPPLNCRSFTSYSTQASEVSAPAFLFRSGARRRSVAFKFFLQGHANGHPVACSPESATGAQRVAEMLRKFSRPPFALEKIKDRLFP